MARTATNPARHTLSYQLREIVESRGLTAYAAAKLAGVDPGIVSRWMTGQRDMRLETADRLALALGLRLVELPGSRPRVPRGRPARPATPRPAAPEPDDPAGEPEAAPGLV